MLPSSPYLHQPSLLDRQPSSAAHPDLKFSYQTFRIKDPGDEFPYYLEMASTSNGKEKQFRYTHVVFREFQASGTPPAGVGSPGDVYINVGSEDAYAVYTRTNKGRWKEWPGGTRRKDELVMHPFVEGRCLWPVVNAHEALFTWVPDDSFKKHPKRIMTSLQDSTKLPAISSVVKEVLTARRSLHDVRTSGNNKRIRSKRDVDGADDDVLKKASQAAQPANAPANNTVLRSIKKPRIEIPVGSANGTLPRGIKKPRIHIPSSPLSSLPATDADSSDSGSESASSPPPRTFKDARKISKPASQTVKSTRVQFPIGGSSRMASSSSKRGNDSRSKAGFSSSQKALAGPGINDRTPIESHAHEIKTLKRSGLLTTAAEQLLDDLFTDYSLYAKQLNDRSGGGGGENLDTNEETRDGETLIPVDGERKGTRLL